MPSRSLCALLAAALAAGALSAAAPPKSWYSFSRRPSGEEGGSGKVYMGREIAWVMGHQGADWLDRPIREKQERTDKLLKILPIKPGMVVADLGAGSGYFSFPLAEKVGPRGKILAVDIQKEMLAIIRKRMKAKKVENIEPIMGTITDPKLPAGRVDLILMVDVYHEFSHPHEMTEAMIKALKPGGLLVFVEYKAEDADVPILRLHKMSQKQVKKEMAPWPLRYVKTFDLPWQHVMLFEKKGK